VLSLPRCSAEFSSDERRIGTVNPSKGKRGGRRGLSIVERGEERRSLVVAKNLLMLKR